MQLRSKGQFATQSQYALQTLLLGIKELKRVRWVKCIALSYLIAWPMALYIDINEPVPIEYARAEEIATSTPPVPVMIEVRIDWTKDRINQEIDTQAAKYGVSASLMKAIVKCESGYDIDIQSHMRQPYGQEESYGLVQIHLKAHKGITIEQATDPIFALDFLAKNLAAGNSWMWKGSKSCWSK